MPSLRYVRAAADDATAVLSDDYTRLYQDVYAEPPYNGGPLYERDRFLDRTCRQVERPGFELLSAIDTATGELAGFCFGLTFAPGQWWRGDITEPPAQVLNAPKATVIELVLRKQYRGHGHGHRLLTQWLAERAEPYGMLLAHPDAPAHALYLRWGWQIVGTCRPAPDADVSNVLVLPLASAT